jgi:two-component system response regulator MprA
LRYSGYEVLTAADGLEALAVLASSRPAAVIMDVMMPRLDGLQTTRELRAAGNDVPILVLTAKDAVDDRVDGLDAGADDYMVKPFSLEELLARLRALTRRIRQDTKALSPVLEFADLRVDTRTRDVRRGERRLSLTRTEYALLLAFMDHPNQVLDRSWLLAEVWGPEFPSTANSLEVYIGYLRRKTEPLHSTRLIHTLRGVGYMLSETAP